ncbi:hypothetical protein PLICRDRAFT_155920 [Plicaturopsis crispa FD-325 SS-3]|nr:hypothetical protein PLICRDRAFT_155920 [Plicaturopsis crispa FD-325 SS-3]
MSNARLLALATVTGVIAFGTVYSVVYDTYLDTSNPLLTHLPHPLQHSDYFASKSNLLNVVFIKRAWAWTSAAFLALWWTSAPHARTKRRVVQWAAETAVWLVFTSWFFGPAVLERLIAASGGECVLPLPSGEVLTLPNEYCFTKSHVSPSTHPSLFTAPLEMLIPNGEWNGGRPRLRRGHDVSGHIFLLTMSILFLADQLSVSFRAQRWPSWHKYAVGFNAILIAVWLLATYTTSVYFHTPSEKITGYLFGLVGFAITQIPILKPSVPASAPVKVHQT